MNNLKKERFQRRKHLKIFQTKTLELLDLSPFLQIMAEFKKLLHFRYIVKARLVSIFKVNF